MFRSFLKMANHIIAINEIVKAILIQNGLSRNKIETIPIIVELNTSNVDKSKMVTRKKYGLSRKDRIILFVGAGFGYTKGSDLLIEALSEVTKATSNIKLLIVGRISSRELKMIKDKNMENYVIYAGYIPNERLPEIYKASDAIVYLEQRGVGRVLIEAMSMKKCVIALKNPTVAHIIKDGVNGLLVSPNSDDLARAILMVINNQKLANKIGRAAIKSIKQRYSKKIVICKIEKVYKNLVYARPN